MRFQMVIAESERERSSRFVQFFGFRLTGDALKLPARAGDFEFNRDVTLTIAHMVIHLHIQVPCAVVQVVQFAVPRELAHV